MPRLPAMAFMIKEFDEALPSIVFFAVGFNLFEFTTQLMLGDYMGRVANFLLATAAALVVGKAVLLADRLPFPRRFYAPPLIKPILFKTAIYTAVVFLVRILGEIVEYWLCGGTIVGIPDYIAHHTSWHFHAAIQIWVFILFLIYTSAAELNARLGPGELARMFFNHDHRN